MLKKKVFVIAGAAVVTVSLLAGITYAWFTNTQADTPGQITAGKLGIVFQLSEPEPTTGPIPLYPQLTKVDSFDNEYPAVSGEPGTVDDVAEITFTLTNDSDRQVLVKVSGADLIAEGVKGSEVDEKGNAVKGSYPVVLTDTSAVKIRYDFGDLAEYYRKGNDAYIYLPTGTAATNVTVQVWIDGETGVNEYGNHNQYQNATIDLGAMTAIAVQYREAAIRATFPELVDDDLIEIVKLGAFE